MNKKVLNILIVLTMNLCCANSDVVSFIKSSASTVLNWYDYYIKPLWTIISGEPPNKKNSFYEHQDISYSQIDDVEAVDVVLMNSNEYLIESNNESDSEEVEDEEDSEFFTYLSKYDENFYIRMNQDKKSNGRQDASGIFYKFLKFIGYHPSISSDDQNILRPYMTSNRTNGLDVRLILLFNKGGNNRVVESTERQMKLILPGTFWCGDGNSLSATSDNDLGLFYKTDQCCKEHDLCPKYIEAGKNWMNLENNGIFTRSHCECDRSFYKCLKRANTIISNRIGETYFNVLQPQCFSKEYPIVGCIKRRSDKRCFKYVIDDSATKAWQWFDNKKY